MIVNIARIGCSDQRKDVGVNDAPQQDQQLSKDGALISRGKFICHCKIAEGSVRPALTAERVYIKPA